MRFRGVAHGQFLIPLNAQAAGRVLPFKGPFRSGAGWRDPQLFHPACTGLVPLCTSDPHAYAHKGGRGPAAGLAASSGSARRGLRDMPGTPEARTRRAGDRSRSRAPVVTAAVQDRQGRVSAACLPVTSSWPGTGCAPPVRSSAPAGHCLPTATASWNVTRRPHQPPGPAASQGPRLYSAVAPRVIAAGISGRLPACRAGAKPFLPGRIRQGPSMYEMEGSRPASPYRLASCLAVPAPRAARRGQVPERGAGLPAPPTFPGSPPGGARFRTVRTFLLPLRAPRKNP